MSTPILSTKSIGKKQSATSVGIKDTLHHIWKNKLDSNGKKNKKGNNISSVSIKSSTHTMVENMKKDLQNTKKSFTAMECTIKNIEEEEDDSDI